MIPSLISNLFCIADGTHTERTVLLAQHCTGIVLTQNLLCILNNTYDNKQLSMGTGQIYD